MKEFDLKCMKGRTSSFDGLGGGIAQLFHGGG
jgi:hypothetical protein